jgi:hypothetical protein
MRRLALIAVVLALTAAGVACGSGEKAPSVRPSPTRSPLASTGKLAIVFPRPGDTVKGSTVKVRMTLTGAKIVPVTTRDLKPDEGHLHVLLDGRLITMTAALTTDLPNVPPGSHNLRVEFVAGDHAPFSPRVIQETLFTVTA